MWECILDFLRDTVWQSVLGLAAILVTVLLYLADRSRKELSFFSVWTYGELADNNKPWFKTRRFTIMLVNTGKVPIVPSDYEGPITFYVLEPCQILDAVITETDPHNIHPKMTLDEGKLVLLPLLLNPGDSIKFEASATAVRWRSFVHADGRIAGVNTIHRVYSPPLVAVGPFILAVGLTLVFVGIFGIPKGSLLTILPSNEIRWFLLPLGVALIAFVLYGPWQTRITKVYAKEALTAFWRNEIRWSALQGRGRRRRKP